MEIIKILIAEDELLTRIGIRHLVKWEKLQYSIVGEAENGEQALIMVEELKPDILLLDINMPVMNGIDVLKEMKKRQLDCKVIILSCHDEFELVKEALVNGASDYILKSALDNEHLVEALERVKGMIVKERDSNNVRELLRDNNSNMSMAFRQNLLLGLLNGHCLSNNIENIFSIKQKNLFCIVFEINNYETIRNRYENKDTSFMIESMLSIMDQTLSDIVEHEIFHIKTNRFVLLLSFSQMSIMERINKIIHSKVTEMISLVKTYVNLDMDAGISVKCDDYSQIGLAYQEALMAISLKFYYGSQSIFYYNSIQQTVNHTDFSKIGAVENELRKLGIQRKYNEILEFAKSYFSQVRKLANLNPNQIKNLIKEIINIVLLNENIEDFSILERVSLSTSLDEIEDLFFHKFFLQYNILQNFDYNYLSKQAIRYIQKNYNKPISLKTIAESLQISENHISRVFNKNVGVSIPDYINNFRIEKAKELICHSNYKVYEIAELVGFHSVAYFNTIFKKAENCTPNEYKNGQTFFPKNTLQD